MTTARPAEPIAFLKGHGTENDFVIIPDPEGVLDLSPAQVARLCDRRAGIGGDGLLRVVRSAAHPEAAALAGEAEWFMDYRNGDGSVAEMCGNGVRVFARYLRRAGLAEAGDLAVATRAGVRRVHVAKDAEDGTPGDVTVSMGAAEFPGGPHGDVTVEAGGRTWPAVHVSMGNPHAVAFVGSLDEPGDLLGAPASPRPRPTPPAPTSSSSSTAARGTSPCGSTSAAPARPAPAAPAPARSWPRPPVATAWPPPPPATPSRTPSTCPAAASSSPSTPTAGSR